MEVQQPRSSSSNNSTLDTLSPPKAGYRSAAKALLLAATCFTDTSLAETHGAPDSVQERAHLPPAMSAGMTVSSSVVQNMLPKLPTLDLSQGRPVAAVIDEHQRSGETHGFHLEWELTGIAILAALGIFKIYPTRLSIYHNSPDLCDGQAMHHPSHGEKSFVHLFGVDVRAALLVGEGVLTSYVHPNLPIIFFWSPSAAEHIFKEIRKELSADFNSQDGLKSYLYNSLVRTCKILCTESDLKILHEKHGDKYFCDALVKQNGASLVSPHRLILAFTNEKNELSQPRLLIMSPLDVFNCLCDLKNWARAAGFGNADASRSEQLRFLRNVEVSVLYLYQAFPYIEVLAREEALHAPFLRHVIENKKWEEFVEKARKTASDLLPIAALGCTKSLEFLREYLANPSSEKLQEIEGHTQDERRRLILKTLYRDANDEGDTLEERAASLQALEELHAETQLNFNRLAERPSELSESGSNFFTIMNIDRNRP